MLNPNTESLIADMFNACQKGNLAKLSQTTKVPALPQKFFSLSKQNKQAAADSMSSTVKQHSPV